MVPTKLKSRSSRLPDGYRIKKRPLIRDQIPSPYANAKREKCVYISARSPFVSSVKRVKKLQEGITKRMLGQVGIIDDELAPTRHRRTDKQKLQHISKKDANPEPVYIRGTGKAIEKVLGLGNYFQNQDDCRIELKTYSVRTVDDIEKPDDEQRGHNALQEDGMEASDEDEDGEVISIPTGHSPATDAIPDNQTRWLSGLEVAVYLK